ncbi:MAG: endonuclease, partial [Paludibacter sp.]|nr:endonuclease [Paludibacter sp.]
MKLHISFIFCCLALIVFAQAPQGYYDAANGKKDAALKTALFNIIKTHNKLGYYATASFFEQADRTVDGYIWDMYSNKKCMQWSGCGLNREHNLPKSWFGISGGDEEKEPIGCDYHNLYPSDASANSAKGNLPLGEVGSPAYNNGVVKTGTSSFTGYAGKVFE